MKREGIFLGLGSALIGAGLFFNPYVLGWLLRPYPRPIQGVFNLIIIYAFEVVGIFLGGFFIAKRKTLTARDLSQYYGFIATSAFNALLAFVLINIIIYGTQTAKLSLGETVDPITKKYNVSLESFYPGLTRSDISQLLEENWSRPVLYEPFTQYKERPFRGKYVNVDEGGFRYVKNQAPWPPKEVDPAVFVFGGSTTFGYGVADKDTIASYLKDLLDQNFPGKHIALYNFGRAAFYSSQEKTLLERLIILGFVPKVAVFIDGLNDSDLVKVGDIPFFTDQVAPIFDSQSHLSVLTQLPLVQAIDNFIHPPKNDLRTLGLQKDKSKIDNTIERYLTNKKLTEGVSREFGVRPYFIWQPVPMYKYDLTYHPFLNNTGPQRDAIVVYPAMAEYLKTHSVGSDFTSLADMQDGVRKALYVDSVHYSPEMSKNIAEKIFHFIEPGIANL